MTLTVLGGVSLMAVVLAAAGVYRVEAQRARTHSRPAGQRHDELTGLPKRPWLQNRLDEVLAGARRTGGSTAVLVLDVDRFAPVNNRMGHERGDQVLLLAARRLQQSVGTEGIETQRDLELVRSAGCRRGQGYLFSRPVPEEQIEAILAAGPMAPRGGGEDRGFSTVQIPVSETA